MQEGSISISAILFRVLGRHDGEIRLEDEMG